MAERDERDFGALCGGSSRTDGVEANERGTTAQIWAPEPVEDWTSLSAAGHLIGPTNAPVTIVEFGDFECPVCGSYQVSTLQPFLAANPTTASLVYRHWPLSYHRFAMPAARASECAARQGAFAGYHRELFEHQDSLGLKSFGEIAVAAGVPDTSSFASCLAERLDPPSIAADVEAVTGIGGSGTPTILVNGYQWFGLPTRTQLDSILKDALVTPENGE